MGCGLDCDFKTVLAEKLETVVLRGVVNTRDRDFYDVRMPLRLRSEDTNRKSLHDAVAATASRRDSTDRMAEHSAILKEVRDSGVMRGVWTSYVTGSSYAAGLDFRALSIRSSSLRDLRGCRRR